MVQNHIYETDANFICKNKQCKRCNGNAPVRGKLDAKMNANNLETRIFRAAEQCFTFASCPQRDRSGPPKPVALAS